MLVGIGVIAVRGSGLLWQEGCFLDFLLLMESLDGRISVDAVSWILKMTTCYLPSLDYIVNFLVYFVCFESSVCSSKLEAGNRKQEANCVAPAIVVWAILVVLQEVDSASVVAAAPSFGLMYPSSLLVLTACLLACALCFNPPSLDLEFVK